MGSFLHGPELLEVAAGARPIEGVSPSVIGLLGTAFSGPYHAPVLVASRAAGEIFGANGTIPAALDAIFAQASAQVVVVNALDPTNDKSSQAEAQYALADDRIDLPRKHLVASTVVVKNQAGRTTYTVGDDYTVDAAAGVITRVDDGDIAAGATLKIAFDYLDEKQLTTVEFVKAADKLLEAEAVTGAKPRILVAPGWTERVTRKAANQPPTAAPVTSGLISRAEKLRAVIIADGPNTTDAEAIKYRQLLSSRRVYVVDPAVKVIVEGASGDVPASGYVAGLIARNDRQRGYWTSPSNRQVLGIAGAARVVNFILGDTASSANTLNAAEVATIIRSPLGGYRLWGNRTCSDDPKWAFLPVVRTADAINDALLRSHLWAIDRNLTKTYTEDVVEGVNDFLRRLIAQGAILSGRCWADPARNTAAERDAGRVYFDFEFDPPAPAERITFRSRLTTGEAA